jgi:hypothetical protein
MADNQESLRYHLDISKSSNPHRSLSILIASRRCYQDQQGEDDAEVMAADPQQLIRQIADHCASSPDYLLPDTPLKESIFRTLLAAKNQPMTAQEISRQLSDRWSTTAQARDVSPKVIQRLLENSPLYSITPAAKQG